MGTRALQSAGTPENRRARTAAGKFHAVKGAVRGASGPGVMGIAPLGRVALSTGDAMTFILTNDTKRYLMLFFF